MRQSQRRTLWKVLALAPTGTIPLPAVQDRLNVLGYDVGPSDGLLGKRTQAALREFQEEVGLPVTGQLDTTTRRALGLEEASWQ
jgi:hypothetical protein